MKRIVLQSRLGCPSKHNRWRGFALVEVLVAFVVLSIGLMGLAALQVKAVKYNRGAYARSQANAAANSMLETMRLVGGLPSAAEKTAWDNFIAEALPDGSGTTSCGSVAPIKCSVTVNWSDSTAPSGTQTLTVKTVL